MGKKKEEILPNREIVPLDDLVENLEAEKIGWWGKHFNDRPFNPTAVAWGTHYNRRIETIPTLTGNLIANWSNVDYLRFARNNAVMVAYPNTGAEWKKVEYELIFLALEAEMFLDGDVENDYSVSYMLINHTKLYNNYVRWDKVIKALYQLRELGLALQLNHDIINGHTLPAVLDSALYKSCPCSKGLLGLLERVHIVHHQAISALACDYGDHLELVEAVADEMAFQLNCWSELNCDNYWKCVFRSDATACQEGVH